MASVAVFFFSVLLFVIQGAWANTASNVFLVPPAAGPTKDYLANPTYQIGSRLQLEWQMNFTDAKLELCQDNRAGDLQGGACSTIINQTSLTSFNWAVSYEQLDPTVNDVYYLSLFLPGGNSDTAFTCHYFYLVKTSASSSTSSLSTMSTSTMSASTTSANPQTTNTANSAATTTPAPSSGLTPGQAAGIAVGSICVFLLATAALGYVLWRKIRRRGTSTVPLVPTPYATPEMQKSELGGNPLVEADNNYRVSALQEMQG